MCYPEASPPISTSQGQVITPVIMLLLVPVGIEIGFVEEDAKLAMGLSKFAIVSFLGNPTAGKIGKVILKQYCVGLLGHLGGGGLGRLAGAG